MSDHRDTPTRLLELLADRALFGLEPEEADELRTLLRRHPEVDAEQFDRLVAGLEETVSAEGLEPMPSDVRAKVVPPTASIPSPTNADMPVVTHPAPDPRDARNRTGIAPARGWNGSAGWLVAAASLLLAAMGWMRGRDLPIPSATVDVAAARTAMLKSGTGVFQGDWQIQADPTSQGASGDVVWSDREQTGFMRFRGLAANDPRQEQYQLWIFDATQDPSTPIDGGVFDVPNGVREVIVPINANLKVSAPTLFAITVEKPGGVVVSKRTRLPLLAKVGSG